MRHRLAPPRAPRLASLTVTTALGLALAACGTSEAHSRSQPGAAPGASAPTPRPAVTETAYLAGGCFWGMEALLRKVPGVVDTEVGQVNGAETVEGVFDTARLSYADLLEKHYFRMHDPTTVDRQGNDVGREYRSAIFTTSDAQARVARAAKQAVERARRWPRPLTTEIAPAGPFDRADEAHQDYLQKHPNGYTCHFVRDWL
jgi:methionine-S-sulfoxide reductase